MINAGLAGKRVTVAGASGFIGTNLVSALVHAGATVRGVVHQNPPQENIVGVSYIRADLTSKQEASQALQETDIFIMAAANSSGAAVMENRPLSHLTPNVIMNAVTLEAAYENGVKKYCFISSNTVYPDLEKPMKESDVTGEFFHKYQVVGEMKVFSEKMARLYSTFVQPPMDTLVVRPGNLYGPFDKFSVEESKVIPALIRRAAGAESPFVVWGDGLDVKDFLYISDFVDGLLLALQIDERELTINLASGTSVPLTTIIRKILDISGQNEVVPVYDTSKPTMISARNIEIGSARKLLGWEPQWGLSDGLAATYQWYVEQKQKPKIT